MPELVLNYHSILYQRGVYPADDFHLVKKYGQTVMLTEDAALVNYLDKILKQINGAAHHSSAVNDSDIAPYRMVAQGKRDPTDSRPAFQRYQNTPRTMGLQCRPRPLSRRKGAPVCDLLRAQNTPTHNSTETRPSQKQRYKRRSAT